MKKLLQTLVLLLMAIMVPVTTTAANEQLADGVYLDGSTLYITSDVTSLGPLQVNPSTIYSFAAVPPTCAANTFSGYGATLHMPAASYGAYFTADYWSNFTGMQNNAVEPTKVSLSNDGVELVYGSNYSLTATVSPSNASLHMVQWSSTDSLVATVDDGKVTTVSAGECDIIASCLDKQAVCHVTVVDPVSVTLDQTQVTLEQTFQVTLTAIVSPEGASNQSVTWATTDASIATASNGVVTAVGVGECDIIASYLDKQAVCHVTVVEATIYIMLDKHESKLLPNHSLTITPTMTPLSTTLKVTSSDSTVAVARLVNGVVQVVALAEGSTMVIVGSTDGKAVSDTCHVTVFTQLGDVNCDGYIDISDVTNLIDHLLGGGSSTFNATNADTDRDGKVDISDVTMLIDALLGGMDLNPSMTETFMVNGVTFYMVAVEGGTFTMGATPEQGSEADYREKPAHNVTLSNYIIGQTEVTQELWLAVMGYNPSGFTGNLQHPVENVSWNDCQEFINKLNELTGRTFRLPTEAEWEFAARGGKKSKGYKYSGSNNIDDVAWYYENSNDVGTNSPDYGTHIVATKKPNELGLYDMSGNVFEWCHDWYNSGYYAWSPAVNPTGPDTGSTHVSRGGSWGSNACLCRVSNRMTDSPSFMVNRRGLRLASSFYPF